MVLYTLSAVLIIASAYLISSCLNKEKNIFGLIYVFLIAYASVVLNFEILSLFSAISKSGILILNVIELSGAIYYWLKSGKPCWSINLKSFFKRAWLGCLKDKYLLIMALAWAFLMFVTVFLIVVMPSVNPDGDAYHVLRSLFWIGNHNLNHFDIADFRNLSMPINSEILYAWSLIFIQKLLGLGIYAFCGYLLYLFSVNKFMDYFKISIRPKLWVMLLVTSFPAVIVQLAGTETDIIIAGLLMACMVLYWNALKTEKQIPMIMSALAFALAVGTKTTAFIAMFPMFLFMLCLSVKYKKNKFYNPFMRFIGYFTLGFILFSAYNYVLNFLAFGDIRGSENIVLGHKNSYPIKCLPANIIKHLFMLVDFTGFRWADYFGGYILNFRDSLITFLHFENCPDGIFVGKDKVNQSLLEPLMGMGVPGILTVIPSVILAIVVPMFKRTKKTLGFLALALMYLLIFVVLGATLQYMTFSIRFVMSFTLLIAPVFAYTYSKKNNPYKFILLLFILYSFFLISTHLWARPYTKIIKHLKKSYTIHEIREISRCSVLMPSPPVGKMKSIYFETNDEGCQLRNTIVENVKKSDRVLYFPNKLEYLVSLKMLDFYGYHIDYALMEDMHNLDLAKYDYIVTTDNQQVSLVIKHFQKGKSRIISTNELPYYLYDLEKYGGCVYIGNSKYGDFINFSQYPYVSVCKMSEQNYKKSGFEFYKSAQSYYGQDSILFMVDGKEKPVPESKIYIYKRKIK